MIGTSENAVSAKGILNTTHASPESGFTTLSFAIGAVAGDKMCEEILRKAWFLCVIYLSLVLISSLCLSKPVSRRRAQVNLKNNIQRQGRGGWVVVGVRWAWGEEIN